LGIIELIILSIGLAMDAFAVAVCKGLAMPKMNWKKGIIIGTYFGIFQALMPLVGYLLGVRFQESIQNIDHWIAFILLGVIGLNMLKEATSKETEASNDSIKLKDMLILGIATSIDALAVGITFAFLKVNIWLAISLIGIITFVISVAGVKIGNIFGDKYEKKAEFAGGLILILLGCKILFEHLNML
jgi:putative Mn2+ efflux pump MntP